MKAERIRPSDRRLPQRRGGTALRYRDRHRFGRGYSQRRLRQRQAARPRLHFPPARGEYHRHGRPGQGRCFRSSKRPFPPAINVRDSERPHHYHSRLGARRANARMSISMGLVIMVVFVFLRSVRTTMIPERRGARFPGRHLRRPVPVRLQHRQSLADGADHRHRIRGGRRHRGDRKHHAASGGGHDADGRRAQGRQRNRIHGALHQHFA